MRIIPLIAPPLASYSPESYREYIRSLYVRPPSSTPVNGIKICFGEKVTQVRFTKGKKREIKKKEIELLAEFYKKKYKEILELMKLRKVVIV